MDSSLTYWCTKGSPSSDPTSRNINYLNLTYISPAERYFDLVTTHLHDIEEVYLKTIDWGRTHNDSVIDLTCFKKLKIFTYKTGLFSFDEEGLFSDEDSDDYDDSRKDDFVLLKYTNGEEHYHYMDEEKNKNPREEYRKNSTKPSLTVICDASVSLDFYKK